MSNTVLIVLIVAVAVIIVLFMFRRRLSSFGMKANKEGFEAQLKTHEKAATPSHRAGINISGNKQFGARNKIDVGLADVNVEDNVQSGEDQEITARPDPTTDETKR